MRYAMRIAESASHQIFERKWRRFVAGMFGSVCQEIAQQSVVDKIRYMRIESPIKRGRR